MKRHDQSSVSDVQSAGAGVGQGAGFCSRPGSPPAASGSGKVEHGASAHPPGVTRGEKLHHAEQRVSIDWFTGSAPESVKSRAIKWLRARFGELSERPGMHFYRRCLVTPLGAKLLFDPICVGEGETAHCTIQLPGESLAIMGGAARLDAIRELVAMGFQATRLDVAVDFVGEGVNLVAAVQEACRAGQLTGARVWRPDDEFTSDGRMTQHCVRLGRRGRDGSGRFVRCYDKGLETKTLPAGEWQRWECEFSGECARWAVAILLQADDLESGRQEWPVLSGLQWAPAVKGWRHQAVAIALGAVDFREPRKGVSRSLRRRRRASWWAEVLGSVVPERIREAAARVPNVLRTAKHWARCLLPGLRGTADALGMTLEGALEWLQDVSGEPVRLSRTKMAVAAERFQMAFPGPVHRRRSDPCEVGQRLRAWVEQVRAQMGARAAVALA